MAGVDQSLEIQRKPLMTLCVTLMLLMVVKRFEIVRKILTEVKNSLHKIRSEASAVSEMLLLKRKIPP